jgi:uncharacterized SAM-binding protein YcdF (DUF218 family)
LTLVIATPVLKPWISALSRSGGDGDVLIVLGGELIRPGLIGVTSYWRSVNAILAWRKGHFRRMIVSGVNISEPMRDFIVSQGVQRDLVVLENESKSTRENALFVARLLKNDGSHKVLLTSDYHMRRALGAFHRAGVEASPMPFRDAEMRMGQYVERSGVFCILAQETGKSIYYKLRGWT